MPNIESVPVDLESRLRKSLDLMRPYLQADGVKAVFEFVERNILHISIQADKQLSVAELFMIKLGVEKKILEQHKEIEGVELV